MKKFFLLLLLIMVPAAVHAQGEQKAFFSQPRTGDFPRITLNLGVYDANGDFVSGLEEKDVELKENNLFRPIENLQELETGMQMVFAWNISPPFAIRDEVGTSRYDYVRDQLVEWAVSLPPGSEDDLSLISNDGLESTHLSDPAEWAALLADHESEPRETASNLNVLSQAIEIASDPPPSEGMEMGVFLITAPPSPEGAAALQSLTALAVENRVRIYVWMVSSPAFFDSEGSRQLEKSARETDGAFFAFSGDQSLPDPEDYFDPLRNKYRLTYRSQISSPGTHLLEAVIQAGGEVITARREFALDIQPPNPIFVSPPLKITRVNPDPDQEDLDPADYLPRQYPLEVIIEFPDGYPREIRESVLYVDGTPHQTNTEPPFDSFQWDVRDYDTTQTHDLQVKAEDELGLVKFSIEIPVDVIVISPEPRVRNIFKENPRPFIILGGIILAAFALLLLFISGRIQPKTFPSRRKAHRQAPTVPIPRPEGKSPPGRSRIRELFSTIKNSLRRKTIQEGSPVIKAALQPYSPEAKNRFNKEIPVYNTGIRVGKASALADLVLVEDSISDLHARIEYLSPHTFEITDQGSISGTWVNYQEVEKGGAILENGDIIHFGNVGFLFILKDPETSNKGIVIHEEHEL